MVEGRVYDYVERFVAARRKLKLLQDEHGNRLMLEDVPEKLRERKQERHGDAIQSLQALERAHILSTLDKVGWNRKRAAELLQISTTTLWRRLKEFGIETEVAVHGAKGGLHA